MKRTTKTLVPVGAYKLTPGQVERAQKAISKLDDWKDKFDDITIYSPGHKTSLPDNENPSLFLSQIYLLKYLLIGLSDKEKQDIVDHTLKKMYVDKNGKKVLGLYNRRERSFEGVKKDDVISHDEYTGIVTIFKICDREDLIDQILEYGEQVGYSFNNYSPWTVNGLEYIRYTRQGIHIAFYKFQTDRWPTIWNILWFCISNILSVFKKKDETSGKLMNWIRFELCKSKSSIINSFFIVWRMILKSMYYRSKEWKRKNKINKNCGPMECLSRRYFLNPEYPLHELMRVYDEVLFGIEYEK